MLYCPWIRKVRLLKQPSETAFPTDLPEHIAVAKMALTKQRGNSQDIGGIGRLMESVFLDHLPLLAA